MHELINEILELQIGLWELEELRSAGENPRTNILIEKKLEELECKIAELKAKLEPLNKLASNQ